MAYPNIGLDWYRLLSIYSELGSSKSTSQKHIETELQTLRALNVDVVNAIQGVNQTLRNLISRGNSKLTDQELAKLKQAVVDGMAEHVSQNPAQCSTPVACDGESILFTPEVREVLASLVEQKAAVLNGTEKHLTEQEVQDIAKAVAAEMDVRNLSTQSFKNAIGAFFQDEQKVEALADVVARRIESVATPSTEALTDALRTFFGIKENWDAFAATIVERMKADAPKSDDRLDIITGQLGYLTKKNLTDPEMNLIATKVVEKMGSRNVNQEDMDAIAAKVAEKMPAALPTNSLGTDAFKDALRTFFQNRENFEEIGTSIVEKMGGANTQNNEAFVEALRAFFEDGTNVQALVDSITNATRAVVISDVVDRPMDFDEELYQEKDPVVVCKMFLNKDSILYLRGSTEDEQNSRAFDEYKYVKGKDNYNHQKSIDEGEMNRLLDLRWGDQRFTLRSRETFKNAIKLKARELMDRDSIGDIGILRIIHSYLIDNNK